MSEKKQSTGVISGKCDVLGMAEFSGIRANIFLGGKNASMTVMDLVVEPKLGAPAHISKIEDKVFLIKEGRLLFLVDTKKFEAVIGDCIFVERGLIHGFSTLSETPARMTLISTPSGHDEFFKAMSKLPKPHRMEDVNRICSSFSQAIVGPIVEC